MCLKRIYIKTASLSTILGEGKNQETKVHIPNLKLELRDRFPIIVSPEICLAETLKRFTKKNFF